MYLQEAWRDCKNADVCSYNVLFAMMETMRKGNEVKIYSFNLGIVSFRALLYPDCKQFPEDETYVRKSKGYPR